MIHLKRYDEALQAIDEAISRSPNLFKAWNNRGAVLWHLNRHADAAVAFATAAALDPTNRNAIEWRELAADSLDDLLGRDS